MLAMDFNEIQFITVFGPSLPPAAFFSSSIFPSLPAYVPASVIWFFYLVSYLCFATRIKMCANSKYASLPPPPNPTVLTIY